MLKRTWLLLLGVLLLVGCGTKSATETAPADAVQVTSQTADDAAITKTAPAVLQIGDDTVIAEAVIEPTHWSELGSDAAGQVAKVLVTPGDQVSADTPLIRLDTATLELSLQSARQEVLSRQAALDQAIRENAQTAKEHTQQVAQAEIALQVAQWQANQTQAQNSAPTVVAAQANVEQLQLQLAQSRALDPAPAVTMAQVELTRAQVARDYAQTEYNEALDRPWEPQEVVDGYANLLQQAQFSAQLAQAQLNSALNAQQAHAVGLNVLTAQIDESQANLTQAMNAQKAYSITLDILNAQVDTAQLELDSLLASQDLSQDDNSNTETAEAEASLEQAKLSVTQIELQMQEAELCAPFAGTVVEVQVEVGEQVNVGETMVLLATLDQLETRTTDLSELDVAHVAVGQPAVVTVDALPGREFAGVVHQIALRPEIVDGNVTYAVNIKLTDLELAKELRWGMTAIVQIKIE